MPRVGLGCMRLSTDADRDEDRAAATLLRALDEGATWLDTARAYGHDDADCGHNERLVERALRERPAASPNVRVITKCGMTRPDGRWEPDGRSLTIQKHASESAAALGRPADVLLLHAPDPGVPFETSVRALLRTMEAGHSRSVGLSNVSRAQLDAYASMTSVPLGAVEVALSAFDDLGARGGVVSWCKQRGVPLLAHAPLGGPSRAKRLGQDGTLRSIAQRYGVTPAMVMIAYLLALDELVVPLVGARRPESVATAFAAERIVLEAKDIALLDARFPGLAMVRNPPRPPFAHEARAEVVIVMGVAGSGKTRLAESYVAAGYERLNRDSLGGTLRGLAQRLEALLASGATRVVLDNTYLTRASRSEVVRVAHAKNARVRCVHVDTPSNEVRINCVVRMLDRHGELLGGSELARRTKSDANLFAPTALYRMERQLERPGEDEGFSSIETVPFMRNASEGRAALVVPIELAFHERIDGYALREDAGLVLEQGPSDAPVLLYGFRPSGDPSWSHRAEADMTALSRRTRAVEVGVCPHAIGPPVCWCRPPLPGLWVAFARRHRIDARKSLLLTRTPAHRAMANALGVLARSLSENRAGHGSDLE